MRIFYFSGTGNTKAVCGMLKDALDVNHKCPTECISIESFDSISSIESIVAQDMIGIAYPIYGLGCPHNVLDFTEKLKKHLFPGQKVFILQTAGDFIRVNHWAGVEVEDILKTVGVDLFYERIIVMGANFFIKYDDRFNKQLYETAIVKTAHMADEIVRHVRRHPQRGPVGKVLTSLVHYGESHHGAAIFGKTLKADATCDRCGICVRQCPVGNPIMTESGVVFTKRCLMCMRCVYACHKRCIGSNAMGWVILKDGYDLMKYVTDTSLPSDFVNDDTKGFYKHFNTYLKDITI